MTRIQRRSDDAARNFDSDRDEREELTVSMEELLVRLDDAARTPCLLVASDFDGTIAPIVSDPASATANRDSLVALKLLSEMHQTHVAIISGRALGDLATRTGEVAEAHLVGSHGSEFDAGMTEPLTPEERTLMTRLREALYDIAGDVPGVLIEEKPASFAFHFRNADPEMAHRCVQDVLNGPAKWAGVHVYNGKKVVELSVVHTHKGLALQKLRQHLGASAVVFLGDDVTDENAFATLQGPDIGIKVGEGSSTAAFRVADTADVSRLLARLAEKREAWLAGSHAVPIERHSLLSDQRTVALVDPRGRVVWACMPRIDSSAIFAELIGGPTAGFFEVRPDHGPAVAEQRYDGDTFILETRWPSMTTIDYLDCGAGRAHQRAGRSDLIRVVTGKGAAKIVFAPRLDFGRVETRLRLCDDGIEVEGTVDSLVLRAPGARWRIMEEGKHQTAVGTLPLSSVPCVLEFRYGTSNLGDDLIPEADKRARTVQHWSTWAQRLRLPSVRPDLVKRSALVLRALVYGPTGAIAAAATTSLPESAGGVRNWDYRYCWPRDAALSASALVRLGVIGPAMKFLDWMLEILDRSERSSLVAPVYTVTAAHLGPEAEIRELAGYRGSRPVRIGNSAGQQVQLDVLGPIADLLAQLAQSGADLSAEHWRMVSTMVEAVDRRWQDPDHGIWEVRRARQHHVHSKVMCWQTVDRAIHVARYLGKLQPHWAELRDRIAADVLQNGWKPEVSAFCATYDDTEPDAAALSVGLSGLLCADDPRYLGTIDYVCRHLLDGPVVYRYRYDDGLPGHEGGFLICTSWLIEAMVQVGRIDKARALFEQYVDLAGPTGLLTEEYDPHSDMTLGNFPQAYSHLGLINAALRLDGR